MAAFQDKAKELYREIAQVPVAAGGRILRSGEGLYEVEVKWSQKDLDRGSKVTFAKSYLVRRGCNDMKGLTLLTTSSFQRDATSVVFESYSSSGEIKAVLMKGKSSKMEQGAEPQQFIEIWRSNSLVKSFNVKELFGKKHGKINEDDQFSSFQLSSDGSKLLYIAEKKVPDSTSYFKKDNGDEGKSSEPKEIGTEYVYRQSWGEQLSTVISPVVVVLDIQSEECTVINSPSNFSCGRARWVPNSTNELAFVGYDSEPLKLGFVYCFNRKSTLFYANIDTNISTPLTNDTKYIYSLRFKEDASALIFMENDTDLPYPHRACARIQMVDWKTKDIKTITDIINKPTSDGFTGVYSYSFPDRCWEECDRIYYHDNQKCCGQIMCINVNTGSVSCVTADTEKGAYAVLDVFDGLLLGRYANPAHPMKIFIAEIPSGNGCFGQNSFCDIATTTISTSDNIKWEIVPLKREDSGGFPYEAIFVSPRVSASPPPLVVFPHGGPHTVYVADFGVWNACLVSLGYSVMLVNYNGSTGYGQDFVRALLGKVGTMDVKDVQYAAETIVKMDKADGKRVVALGGSHGGFLSVHVVAQFPDFYQAAFVRNPVINIASMRNLTDITDWAHSVTGLPYDPKVTPTAEEYSTMLSMSPIVHASKIKAAITLAIGAEDLRCPPSQARELYTLLHAQGKDIKMFLYPKDCHPLISVDTDADCFMQCALLFDKKATISSN